MSPSFSLSGTDEAASWRELQVRAKFPEYTEVSAPLAARIAKHNADVTKAKETINDAMAAVTEAVAKAESAEPGAVGDVIAAGERCRLDRGVALQSLAESWQRREDLAKECIAEFAKLLPPAEKALAAAQDKARGDLAKIGCSQDALLKAGADAEARGWANSAKVNTDTVAKLKANGMDVVTPPAALKADMAKVGDTMLKEWLDKAGPEGKALIDAYRK